MASGRWRQCRTHEKTHKLNDVYRMEVLGFRVREAYWVIAVNRVETARFRQGCKKLVESNSQGVDCLTRSKETSAILASKKVVSTGKLTKKRPDELPGLEVK
jgi:hypothetical protein